MLGSATVRAKRTTRSVKPASQLDRKHDTKNETGTPGTTGRSPRCGVGLRMNSTSQDQEARRRRRYAALGGVHRYVAKSGLPPALIDLDLFARLADQPRPVLHRHAHTATPIDDALAVEELNCAVSAGAIAGRAVLAAVSRGTLLRARPWTMCLTHLRASHATTDDQPAAAARLRREGPRRARANAIRLGDRIQPHRRRLPPRTRRDALERLPAK